MRRRPLTLATVAAAALTLVALPLPIEAQAPPCVRIAELQADPDPALAEREFIELWNCGESPVALAGWKVRDAPTTSGSVNTFTFPTWTVAAGGRVVVWGGGAGDGRGPAWSNPTVWNNAGDAASLLDPAGTLVDWLGYGTTAPPPPEFADRSLHPRPGQGQSLQLDGDAWIIAAPTPGTVLGASTGSLQVVVSNAPPQVSFADLPRSIRPGTRHTFRLALDDANGAGDITAWTLTSGTATLASGTQGGLVEATVAAPRTGATWDLRLQATDSAGAAANTSVSIPLRFSDLVVELPSQAPLQFPASAPGSAAVAATGQATLRNLGASTAVPLLDVSAFSGPSSFPAEGNLEIGWPDGNGTRWLPYLGPLTPLPEIPPDGAVTLGFRLKVPTGVPAGQYGTSFAVVPR